LRSLRNEREWSIYLERTDDGADVALRIDSADGSATILRFRAAVLPEAVDGIVRP
jgi:hypothetical protein